MKLRARLAIVITLLLLVLGLGAGQQANASSSTASGTNGCVVVPSLQLGDFNAKEHICVLYRLFPAAWEKVIQQLAIAGREHRCQPTINRPRTVAVPVTLHCRGHVLAEFLTRRTARANAQCRFHERERVYQVRPVQRELQRHEATIRVPYARAAHEGCPGDRLSLQPDRL